MKSLNKLANAKRWQSLFHNVNGCFLLPKVSLSITIDIYSSFKNYKQWCGEMFLLLQSCFLCNLTNHHIENWRFFVESLHKLVIDFQSSFCFFAGVPSSSSADSSFGSSLATFWFSTCNYHKNQTVFNILILKLTFI